MSFVIIKSKAMHKKITFIIVALFCCLGFTHVNAQTKKKEPAKVETSAPVRKADGSLDMRYKKNKELVNKRAKGPRKKDGTPDMRYKKNKEALRQP